MKQTEVRARLAASLVDYRSRLTILFDDLFPRGPSEVDSAGTHVAAGLELAIADQDRFDANKDQL